MNTSFSDLRVRVGQQREMNHPNQAGPATPTMMCEASMSRNRLAADRIRTAAGADACKYDLLLLPSSPPPWM